MARILVANPDPIERLILTGALEAAGHTVEQVNDGREALEVAALSPPAALILDEVMPRSGGRETGREIRSRVSEGVPIVLLATRANGKHDIGTRTDDVILGKPIDPEQVVAAIARIVD